MLLCSIVAGAQTLEGTFTQAKTIQASGRVIRSQGNFSFTAPDQLAMIYTQPDGDFFIIDGPVLRMDLRGNAVQLDTRRNALAKAQSDAILFSISGNYQRIAESMNADMTESTRNGVKTVTITARQAAPRGYSKLILDYRAGKLTRMVLEEFGGISTEYMLQY